MSGDEQQVSRRSVVKAGVAGIAGLIIGAVGGYFARAPEEREVTRTTTVTQAAQTITETATKTVTSTVEKTVTVGGQVKEQPISIAIVLAYSVWSMSNTSSVKP